MKTSPHINAPMIALAVMAASLCGVAAMTVWTRPTRESVQVYVKLVTAANGGDVAAAERLCSTRYRFSHQILRAPEGGIVGLPRNIHKNFQVWREGSNVWLCPTNRVGPVYQFVLESGAWRFDGPVGVLQPGGRVVRLEDGAVPAPEEE
jgi:hypothetical protein